MVCLLFAFMQKFIQLFVGAFAFFSYMRFCMQIHGCHDLLLHHCRTPPTSTSRLSWWMQLTMLSAMTQESTGSAIQFTSTGSFVDLLLLVRSTEVSAERDTCTTRPVLQEEQPGRGTIHSPSGATVNFCNFTLFFYCHSLLDMVRVQTLKRVFCFDIFVERGLVLLHSQLSFGV